MSTGNWKTWPGLADFPCLVVQPLFFIDKAATGDRDHEEMEDMDNDLVVDIPNTPDRLSSRRMKRRDVHKENNLSVASHVGGSNFAGEGSLDRSRRRGRLVAKNRHNRKHYKHLQKLLGNVDEIERKKNTIILSPLENALLFRIATMERSKNSIRDQYMDKEKVLLFKFPSRSSGFSEDHAILDLIEQNMHNQTPEMALLQVG
ncbi:hypothetical protein REPUB_Repub05bG0161000 [Reevesia pubescens]